MIIGENNEECTCSTDLCNDKSISATFPSHVDHIDCWHCSSTIQPWCSGVNLTYHVNDPGVRKSCHSATCLTSITGTIGNIN